MSEDRVKARLATEDNEFVSAHNPLSTNGDSVYAKDVKLSVSDVGTFTGVDLLSLFNNLDDSISDSSATNPKYFEIKLERPITSGGVGIISHTGDFSNVHVEFRDRQGNLLGENDDSSNNTEYTSKSYPTTARNVCCIKVSFHTSDVVTVSFLRVAKDTPVTARLKALKPDGTETEVQATAGGNLKFSLEERENTFVFDDNLEIARGNLSGLSKVNKYGRAKNGVQVTATDIWDRADASATQQIWLAPTAARIHTIVSTSTADDGNPEGGGAGAQAVRVWYLADWDTVETSEDVILNGTGGVAMNNAAVIIHRMKVIPVGTTYKVNTGIITATAAVDSTITAQINAGEGQTLMAVFGIPSIQTAYMPNYDISGHNTGNPSTAVEVDVTMLINERPDLDTTTFLNKSNIGLITSGTSAYHKVYKPYFSVTGPAIIKFQATATLADTEGAAEFDLIIVDN